MSTLKELLNKHCPDGVEWKKLGEVCNVQSGGTPLKTKVEYWENGNIKWLGSGVCKNKKTVDEITDYISELGLTKSSAKLMKENTTLIALVGTTIGKVAFLPFEAAINQNIAGIYPIDTKILNPSFVYYICTTYYKDFISLGNGKLTMANLSFVRNLKIPVPPIEVQKEIVRILDTFTKYQDLLNRELELRKKQYEYYRGKLLTFGDEVEKIQLKDLFYTKNGYTPSKSNPEFWDSKDVSWFRMEDIRENGRILNEAIQKISFSAIKGNVFPKNSIIVSTSATIGEHALITCESLANQRFTYLILKDEYKDKFNIFFIFYYCYKLKEYCLNCLNQGNFASVDMTKFNKFEFPIISLKEQERIVKILDQFDTLCNDITRGLPAEIEMRKKQYEYYRDKLLTFKEKK